MARKISADEARKLGGRPLGKKHHVRTMLETLEQGEFLHITREDFNWKRRTPMFFCNQITKATDKKFNIVKTTNNRGWVVERV